jgi:hypothetical protein
MGHSASPASDGAPNQRDSPRRRHWLWLELAVAGAVAILFAVVALGFVLEAVGAYPRQGSSRAAQAILAVVFIGLAVLCGRWALHVEHRLRRGGPVASAFEAVHMRPAGGLRLPPGVGRRRGYGPVGTSVLLAVFVLATLAFIGGAIGAKAAAARSSYVQQHGVRAIAIVDSVDNTEHCSRSGCDYTSAITATLGRPVQGRSVTVIHYRGRSDLLAGESVLVLVDPKQPSYAEVPGARFESSWGWILAVVGAVCFAWMSWFEARLLRRLLGHRRVQRVHGVTRPASI